MTGRRITVSLLCISLLLLANAVSAVDTGTAVDGRTTLRASTAAAGSPLVQAANDAAPGASHPAWIGLLVLSFGGLLAGLWLVAGTLSVLRAIGDPERPLLAGLPRLGRGGRRDEALSDWF